MFILFQGTKMLITLAESIFKLAKMLNNKGTQLSHKIILVQFLVSKLEVQFNKALYCTFKTFQSLKGYSTLK